MTITPTALLSLPIITTGTESGTWGDVVDNGLTSYLDIAIAGGLSIVITTADVTLANTAGTSAATGIISTTAQYAILNISGAKTAARNLNLPVSSREYTINNAGTGGFLLTVRGVTPTTGVTLVDGEKAIVAWGGADYVKIASSVITNSTGTLPIANGGTGTTSTTFASLTTNVSGILPVANGGTGAATLTANNVVLGNGTSTVQFIAPSTSGNVLTSDGTTWASTALSAAGVSSLNGQTGAITDTAFGSIGSVVMAANTSTAYTMPGGTIAGSSLVYPSTFVAQGPYDGVSNIVTNGPTPPYITTIPNTTMFGQLGIFRSVVYGNTGYFVPLGTTALSGTWRAMTFSGARDTSYDFCTNVTNNYSSYTLWVRVS